jgi:hypothetical protein
MRKSSISEKSSNQKRNSSVVKELLTIPPGNYMMVDKNEIKRISLETLGLFVGNRVENDNHMVVLVDEQLILVPKI